MDAQQEGIETASCCTPPLPPPLTMLTGDPSESSTSSSSSSSDPDDDSWVFAYLTPPKRLFGARQSKGQTRSRLLHPSPPKTPTTIGDNSDQGRGASQVSSEAHQTPPHSPGRSSPSQRSPKKSKRTRRVVQGPNRGTLLPLPAEVMHRIFELVLFMTDAIEPMSRIALVSRHWYELSQHEKMWEIVAKVFFVSYPLLQRLMRAAPIDDDDIRIWEKSGSALVPGTPPAPERREDLSVRPAAVARTELRNGSFSSSAKKAVSVNGAPSQFKPTAFLAALPQICEMEPPGNLSIRKGLHDVKQYLGKKKYYELVQRRRAFVIHAFFSLGLLCFSMFLTIAMCAAEGYDPITVCNAETSFHFLWLTYLAGVAAVIANIVMETHFEPQPLLRRLRLHTEVIQASAAALTLCLVFIGFPTLMIQKKVQLIAAPGDSVPVDSANGMWRPIHWLLDQWNAPSWSTCFSPLTFALALWQGEVVFAVRVDIKDFFAAPYFSFSTMYHGFAYATPSLFAISLWCVAQYLEAGGNAHWIFLLVGVMPLGLAFFTLTIVFLLDFSVKHESSDFTVAFALGVANIFTVLVAFTEVRGLTLLPCVVASFSFFVGHFNDLRRRLDEAIFDPDGELLLFDED